MKDWTKQLRRRRKSPMQEFMQGSRLATFFSVFGLLVFLVVAIPAFILFITSIPEIKRYLEIEMM